MKTQAVKTCPFDAPDCNCLDIRKRNNGRLNFDVGASLAFVRQHDPNLVMRCQQWLRAEAPEYEIHFDLAVDCSHDLGIADEDTGWEIPVWLTELAEEIWTEVGGG